MRIRTSPAPTRAIPRHVDHWVMRNDVTTPFKKVTQHDFDRLYKFMYGFVFIMLGII